MDSVSFKLYCAGLSIESEERKLLMTPTSIDFRREHIFNNFQKK